MSAIVETPHKIGEGRWLVVHPDTGTVIGLHGDAVLIERVREGEPWADGSLRSTTSYAMLGVRMELRAVGTDGVWYSAWAPSDDLREVVDLLVAELDR